MRAGFQRGQQNERLLNLRKFRGRREAFKRGREDGVRFRAAARRLIELRERLCRAHFDAARLLASRNRDRGLQRFFCRRGV